MICVILCEIMVFRSFLIIFIYMRILMSRLVTPTGFKGFILEEGETPIIVITVR